MSKNTSLTKNASYRYANALFNLAEEANSKLQYEEDLDKLLSILENNSDFSSFVKSPLNSREIQFSVMKIICSKLNLNENVINTVLLMTSKRRLFALKEMILQYKDLFRLDRNEIVVEVSSVSELSAANLGKIKKSISTNVDSNILIKAECDPSLLGGMIVKVGSKLIDTSIKSKLVKLKNNLKEVG